MSLMNHGTEHVEPSCEMVNDLISSSTPQDPQGPLQ